MNHPPCENLVVEAANPGDPLVVTFGFAQWETPASFDFVGRLRKVELLLGRRFHRIHVRDPLRCWYLRGVPGLGADVNATAASLARVMDNLQPSRVITLGQSMGGYGAILFGRLLKADRVVAFGALSTMDPAVSRAQGDSRWLAVMQALQDDRLPGVATDLAMAPATGRIEMRLHYGQLPDAPEHGQTNLDLFHARRFAALPDCRVTLHPEASHAIVEHLRRADELDACLLGDLFDVDRSLVHRRARPVLADGWVQWIAENRLRDCDAGGLVGQMTERGIDPLTARSAIATVEREPTYRTARSLMTLTRKYESVLINQQRVSAIGGTAEVIERRGHVGRDEFLERYVAASRPLVLTGAIEDWPARRRWSPGDLKARFGEAEVTVQSGRASNPRYEVDDLAHRRRMRLADFVDLVEAGPGNDHYMTANNHALREAPLNALLDDVGSLPAYCRRDGLAAASHFWFGPAGTVTPLHHDTLMILHMHVVGRKRWRFISPMYIPWLYNHEGVYSDVDLDAPDLVKFPLFRNVRVIETVAEPGDTVFIPLGWWHHVTALDTCMSLSMTNFDFANEFSYSSPDLRHW